jgi:hypothetical protein
MAPAKRVVLVALDGQDLTAVHLHLQPAHGFTQIARSIMRPLSQLFHGRFLQENICLSDGQGLYRLLEIGHNKGEFLGFWVWLLQENY